MQPARANEALGVIHRGRVRARIGGVGRRGRSGLAERRQIERRGRTARRLDGHHRRREFIVGGRDLDLVDARLDVLRQIGDIDRFEFRRMPRAIGGQRGLPLHETGRGRSYRRALRSRHRCGPRAPVFLRLIEIAAACLNRDLSAVQTRFEADASPQREHRCIEYIAFDGAFVL